MLGQPDKVRNGSSNITEFHNHGWEPDGEPGGRESGQTPAGTHSIMFIHTNERWDDAPQWLIMLPVCLISLWPLVMWLACKYFLNCLLACIYSPDFIIHVSQYVLSIIPVCLLCLSVFC